MIFYFLSNKYLEILIFNILFLFQIIYLHLYQRLEKISIKQYKITFDPIPDWTMNKNNREEYNLITHNR